MTAIPWTTVRAPAARRPDEQARLRPARRGRHHHVVGHEPAPRGAVGQLEAGHDLTDHPDDIRSADLDQVRPPAGRAQLGHHSVDERRALGPVVRDRMVDRRAEQLAQHDAGIGWVGRRSGQDEVDLETRPCSGGGGQPGVIRPAPAGRDEGVRTLRQRGADEVLQVPQLVPAEGQRQQVLALDPQLGAAAQDGRQARQRRQRRWAVEQREPREAGRIGGPGRHAADGTRPYHRPMATRISPADRHTTIGQHAGMERSIAISAPTVGSAQLYSSIVSTAPGDRTRVHHHGACETSIYIVSGAASYTYGPTGVEHAFEAVAGDFVYIPAGEIHVEANASEREPLVVVLTRNCPDSHVVYLDGGPDGSDDVPAPC